jgi:hypothetical protein
MDPCFGHASGIFWQFRGGGRARFIPPAAFPRISRQDALKRFGVCQGSGAGFRRGSVAINGPLTSTWCALARAVGAVFDRKVVCYG